MTLIIGMQCHDGLLFCADREESTEMGGKRSVCKLHEAHGLGWDMAIGTAGSGPVGDVAARRIIAGAINSADFLTTHERDIETALREIHDQYIFPYDKEKQSERGISLIIGIHYTANRNSEIYKTFEEILKPEDHYACAGAGQDVAHYFLDRFYGDGLTLIEASLLTAFIARESKSSVGGVGRETELLRFSESFRGRTLIGEYFEGTQIPRLSECFKPFWKTPKPSTSETSEQVP